MEPKSWIYMLPPPGFFDRYWTDEEILTEGFEEELPWWKTKPLNFYEFEKFITGGAEHETQE